MGGETIRPRWPLPIGAQMSMMRAVMSSVLPLPAREFQALIRMQGREVLEQHLALGVLGRVEIDLVHLEHGEVTLAVLRRADLAGHGIAGAQPEASDLAGRDIDVIEACEVGALGRAQEPEAVLQDLEHAVTENVLAVFRMRLEDREDEVLLARARLVLDAHVGSRIHQVGSRLLFQFSQIHSRSHSSW